MTDYDLGKVVGADGRGIVSIEKTGTSGLIDTYTITYTDGTTSTFEVKNGEDGSSTVVDSELSTSSTNPVQNKIITTALNGKANTNHNHDSRYYTESEIDTALSTKADSNDIPTKTSDLTNDGDGTNVFVKDNDTRLSNARTPTSHASTENTYGLGTATIYGHVKIINKLSTSAYAAGEALSAYQGRALRDMINAKPDSSAIPTKTSDLTNDGSSSSDSLVYIETSATSGLLKNDGSIDTNSYVATSDIADNLTTNDASKVLSAKQGKALNDLIGSAISYINS